MVSRAIHMLLEVLESRDRQSVQSSKAAADLSVRIGRVLGLSPRSLRSLRLGALLHDIGRLALRDEVIQKASSLSLSEQSHIATHVTFGEHLVGRLLQDADVLGMIRHHHEWYNGRGYPDNLRGDDIPLGARILAVAEAFLSMTDECPQSRRKSEQEALRDLCHRVGLQFCPQVTGALLQALGYRRPGSAAAGTPGDAGAADAAADQGMPQADDARPVSRKELDAKLGRTVELRALPTIVSEVLALTARKDMRIDDLAAKIKCDHALSTKLLRLANSALYGSRMKVESIDRAVLKLGVARVRQLVLGIGVIDHWRQNQDPGMLAGGTFWQHSMSTGLLARQLSVMIDYPDDQNAFTAGLLHDTGQLLLQEALGRQYVAVLANARQSREHLAAVESRFLETNHATVMRQVGPAWHLPESLVEVMAMHHAPWETLQELDHGTLQLLVCVRVANILSHAIGCGDEELGAIELVPAALLDVLQVERSALGEVLGGIPEQVNMLSQAYGLSPESGNNLPLRKRRPPQRRGVYVRESEAAVDPLDFWLEAQGAEFDMAADATAWRRSPATTWCWVRAETPAFAQSVLKALDGIDGEKDRVRGNLLFLLPAGAPATLKDLLDKAGVAQLAEPWNIASLKDVLSRMRSVRDVVGSTVETEPTLSDVVA
jgi:HD-like signal output (HDOD) protein